MLKLYDYFRSSACFRVRIALALKGIAYETIPIHLLKDGGEQLLPNYRVLNPQSLVPTLVTAEDKTITQSMAIIEYLDEVYPEPAFLPEQTYEKSLVRSFALAIVADVHPLNNLRVLNYLTQTLGLSEAQKNDWYHRWLEKGLQALESMLEKRKHNFDFCFSNQPSLADICLIPQLYNAHRYHYNIDIYPHLVAVQQHCLAHPAFKAAWPKDS